MSRHAFLWRLLLAGVLLHPWVMLRADGGTVRLSERRGDHRLTVFTSPTPVRAGPVDVSVLVQDVSSGEPIPQARVLVRLIPRDHPEGELRRLATTEAATNKLFQAAVFDVPQPGWWDGEVVVEGLPESMKASFALEVDEPLPRLWEMTPWITWPALVVVLFLVHQWLVRRRC